MYTYALCAVDLIAVGSGNSMNWESAFCQHCLFGWLLPRVETCSFSCHWHIDDLIWKHLLDFWVMIMRPHAVLFCLCLSKQNCCIIFHWLIDWATKNNPPPKKKLIKNEKFGRSVGNNFCSVLHKAGSNLFCILNKVLPDRAVAKHALIIIVKCQENMSGRERNSDTSTASYLHL